MVTELVLGRLPRWLTGRGFFYLGILGDARVFPESYLYYVQVANLYTQKNYKRFCNSFGSCYTIKYGQLTQRESIRLTCGKPQVRTLYCPPFKNNPNHIKFMWINFINSTYLFRYCLVVKCLYYEIQLFVKARV